MNTSIQKSPKDMEINIGIRGEHCEASAGGLAEVLADSYALNLQSRLE